MFRPSTQRGSFNYEGADLDDYVTPTSQVLPPPPQQPFQVQSSDYIHPITKRDDDLSDYLKDALEAQGFELNKLRYHLAKMVKKQKKERSALMQYLYSLQDREYDQPNQKSNMWYATCVVIVLLVILVILMIVSLTKKRGTDLQTLVTLVQLLSNVKKST